LRGASEEALRLRRLWHEQRRLPFPGAGSNDPKLNEVALYQAWLGSIAEAALARGGRLAPGHAEMLSARRAEGNAGIWAAAGELGEPARSYVARLLAIEELLANLPTEAAP
jgi:hypothetical protein